MAVSGENKSFTVTHLEGTDEEVRAQWLEARKGGVGGSDVAAVLGCSPYKGAYTLWAEKCGLVEQPDLSGNQAVEWGNRLEPIVAQKYKDAHPDRKVSRVNGLCRSCARPWALASLDYQVYDPAAGWGVLEIKTVGLRRAGDWDEGVPLYYQTQVQHYLDVTDRAWCDVAVLIGGQEYREYRLEADESDQAAIRTAIDAFWQLVQARVAPEEAQAVDASALLQVNADPSESYEEVEDASKVAEVKRWLKAKERADKAQEELGKRTAMLKKRIGQARGIDSPTGKVTWKRGTRRNFDKKRFETDQPGVYDTYCNPVKADFGLTYTSKTEEA